ncbi:MAG: ACT domain-containing protein [Ancrocorticia sp.]|jgi:ACT domain-containing protein|nr:ACT domain-containing protein [Ancrocorticia sp.]MCI1963363.1 ACT domain-containing protein [Ancrocorticia sp.]MCI2003148.1 ACT domain-containing protein [Ancrocorticia sp.]MCI2012129.1 ACT domain-containing protein [Ancrocorticia sp.]
MRAIMTVTGLDHTGIIAAVASAAAANDANIVNVSQTLMGEYFTMILQIEFDESHTPLAALQSAMRQVGSEQGLDIHIQSEAIFNAMHRL